MNDQSQPARQTASLTLRVRDLGHRITSAPGGPATNWRAVYADMDGLSPLMSARLPMVYISDDGVVEIVDGDSLVLPQPVFRHWLSALNQHLFDAEPISRRDDGHQYLHLDVRDSPPSRAHGSGRLVRAQVGVSATEGQWTKLPSAALGADGIEFGDDYLVPITMFRAWLDELNAQTAPDAPAVDDEVETTWTSADLGTRYPRQREQLDELRTIAYLHGTGADPQESGIAPPWDMKAERWNSAIERLRGQGHDIEAFSTTFPDTEDPQTVYRLRPQETELDWLADDVVEVPHATEGLHSNGSPGPRGQDLADADQQEKATRWEPTRVGGSDDHMPAGHREADQPSDQHAAVDPAADREHVDRANRAGELARAWPAQQGDDVDQAGQLARAWQAEQAAADKQAAADTVSEASDTRDSTSPRSATAPPPPSGVEREVPTALAEPNVVDQTQPASAQDGADSTTADTADEPGPAASAADPPPEMSTSEIANDVTRDAVGNDNERDGQRARGDHARAQLYAEAEAAIARAQQAVAELRRQEANAARRRADQEAQAGRDRVHDRADAERTAQAADDRRSSNAAGQDSNEIAAVLDRTDTR